MNAANYIGGEFRSARSGATTPLINPATGATIGSAPSSSAVDVDDAVTAASAAVRSRSLVTPRERADMLLAMAEVVMAHRDEIANIDVLNAGKPRQFALLEVDWVIDDLRVAAGFARSEDGRNVGEYSRDHTSMIRREPLGVVAHIEPWNYPFLIAATKLSIALAAGNAVVLKPSELTPLSMVRLAELTREIIPPGYFNVVCGYGDPVGSRLSSHPDVALLSLTGEPATATKITRDSAPTLKRLHFELGGKAPVLIFEDADIVRAIEAVRLGGFWNAGQDCGAAARLLVADAAFDTVVEGVTEAAKGLHVADPSSSDEVEMGPLISAEHRDRVMGLVHRAVDDGARITTGGRVIEGPGFFVVPTVIVGADQRSEIVQTEVFGPVVTIQSFGSDEQALTMANDTPYGLASGVFTASHARAMALSRDLKFGTVWINDYAAIATEMPWGGVGMSGNGTAHSAMALHEYSRIKHVMTHNPSSSGDPRG